MFSTEYVAYKHIIESEKQNIKPVTQNFNKLRECPRYLYPLKVRKVYERNLELNQSSYTDDFILLSEFSEIEGPKPLFTIPTDGGCNFNKNDYSLHVMCVDFHTTQQQQQQNNSTSSNQSNSRFSLTKDTSIINYWDLNSGGIAAYIHHFTLYDIEARGFVRPFCLAYITYDRQKIQIYFNKFVAIFNKITSLFKKSNLNLFKKHLDEHMKNLYYTREKYLLWLNINKTQQFQSENERLDYLLKYDIDLRADLKFQKFNLQTLNNLVNEIESVLDVIKNELEINSWYEYDKPTNETINKLLNRNCDSSSNHVDNLNNNNCAADLTNGELRSQSCTLEAKKVENYSTDNKPKLILDLHGSISYSFNFSLNNSNKNLLHNKVMRNIHQLSPTTARYTFKKLRLIHKYFSKLNYLLKFNDIESKFNNNKTNHYWQLTFGDCIINDFSYKIDIYRLHQYLIRRNNSNEELKYYSININDSSLQYNNNLIDYSTTNYYTPLNQTIDECGNFIDENLDFNSIIVEKDVNNQDDYNLDENGSTYENDDYDFVNSLVIATSHQQQHHHQQQQSSTPSDLKFINEKLSELSEFNFDSILKNYLYKQFPNSFVHILYTLLKGRTLVLVTRSKTTISDKLNLLINCLYNFIPNNYSTNRNIVIYDCKPIKLIDLKYYKIIGLVLNCHSTTSTQSLIHDESHDDSYILLKYLPITIRNYISILNLDKQTFIGPKYNGTYLQQISNKFKYLNNDSICYLYFLKSFNYFYLNLMYLMQNSKQFQLMNDQTEHLDLCKKLFQDSVYATGIDACDLNIVYYLIKSFKLKQIFKYQQEKFNLNCDNDGVNNNENSNNNEDDVLSENFYQNTNNNNSNNKSSLNQFEMPLIVEYENLTTFSS